MTDARYRLRYLTCGAGLVSAFLSIGSMHQAINTSGNGVPFLLQGIFFGVLAYYLIRETKRQVDRGVRGDF